MGHDSDSEMEKKIKEKIKKDWERKVNNNPELKAKLEQNPEYVEQIKKKFKGLVEKKARVAKALLKKPGVHSVGLGYKEKNGVPTDELAFIVFTDKKKPISEIHPDDLIRPETSEGMLTDVVEMPEFEEETTCSLPDRNKYEPVPAGVQLQVGNDFGTLGTYVKSTKDGEGSDLYILSNRHVLSEAGAPVYHNVQGADDTNKIAETTRGDYFEKADAAIAKVCENAKTSPGEIQGIGHIGGVHAIEPEDIGAHVKKYGRTTGFTRGVILYEGVNISGKYEDQIIIKSLNPEENFNEGGDSGSVIMFDTPENLVISLHWGGATMGGTKVSASSPIEHVCEALDITVICNKDSD